MTPKPAYEALLKLIKGKWWTRTEARVSRQGRAQFHGFYGEYTVGAMEHGHEIVGAFTFNAKTPQPMEVRLNSPRDGTQTGASGFDRNHHDPMRGNCG